MKRDFVEALINLDNKLLRLHSKGKVLEAVYESRHNISTHEEVAIQTIGSMAFEEQYYELYKIVKPNLLHYEKMVSKIIFDMQLSNFHREQSVETYHNYDSPYLKEKYGNKYTMLAEINLLEHTSNVVKQTIEQNKDVPTVALEFMIILALVHDFGKASHIKKMFANNVSEHHEMISSNYLNVVANKVIEDETLRQLSETILRMHGRYKDSRLNNDLSRALLAADEAARTIEMANLINKTGRLSS